MGITGIQIYDNLKSWQTQHENNAIVANKMLEQAPQKGWSEETIFEAYENKQEEIGTHFNFMESKDPNNEDEYNAQLHKLGLGNLLDVDTNKDGQASLVEYVTNELKDVDLSDKEFASNVIAKSVLLFSLMDQAMGNSDNSGALSADEFASLYKNFDIFNGEQDGEFSIDDPSNFIDYAINGIFSEETIQKTKDTYADIFIDALSE